VYGSQQKIPDRSILCDILKRFMDGYYETRHPVKEAKKQQPAAA
jgi:hypothetical protein